MGHCQTAQRSLSKSHGSLPEEHGSLPKAHGSLTKAVDHCPNAMGHSPKPTDHCRKAMHHSPQPMEHSPKRMDHSPKSHGPLTKANGVTVQYMYLLYTQYNTSPMQYVHIQFSVRAYCIRTQHIPFQRLICLAYEALSRSPIRDNTRNNSMGRFDHNHDNHKKHI